MASRSFKNSGTSTTISDIHPDIFQTHILSRIDGLAVASISCASLRFHELCANEKVWRDICHSTWNSTKHPLVRDTISTFPRGHRAFFSDSFPILHHYKDRDRGSGHHSTPVQTSELISAVDIHYKNELVYSKVEATNTGTDVFDDSIFQVELLDCQESIKMAIIGENDDDMCMMPELTLSWIVIDPTQKRAVNVSSLRPVTPRRLLVTSEIEVRYSTMVSGSSWSGSSKFVDFRILVILGWNGGRELQLRKVSLQVIDMDDECLTGKDSLEILQKAIQSGNRKMGGETEIYRKYENMKRERIEGKGRRLGSILIPGAAIFMAFVFLAFWLSLLYKI